VARVALDEHGADDVGEAMRSRVLLAAPYLVATLAAAADPAPIPRWTHDTGG
jgi:hypothetical protein